MRIEQFNCWSRVTQATAEELDWLRTKLTIETKNRGKKGYESLLIEKTKDNIPLVPGGWHRTILAHARKTQQGQLSLGQPPIQIEVVDQRVKPCEPNWGVNIGHLYPFQLESLRALVAAEQGILKSSTGSGKSETFIAGTMVLPCTWLILVQDRSLLTQTADLYHKRTGKVAGVIGDGRWSTAQVTIAMVQSLANKLKHPEVEKFLLSRQGVIADEAHSVASASSTAVLRSLHHAWWRWGFSATPVGRSDARDAHVISHLGRIVHDIPDQVLEADGRIAKSEVVFHLVEQPIPPWDAGGYQQAIEFSRPRNQKIADIWRTCEKPCLTYVQGLDHGKYLLEIAQAAGHRALFVQGESKEKERKAAITAFEQGEVDILIGSWALKQGVNIIHVRTEINASGYRAQIPTVQIKGRGGRVCHAGQKGLCPICTKYGLKTSLVFIDFLDVDREHTGKKLSEKSWAEKHSIARMKALTERGHQVKID